MAFVLLVGLGAGAVVGHAVAPPASSGGAPSVPDHLYLTIAFNPYTGLDEYFPANFSVPANTPVTITITNYDNGTNLVPNAFTAVMGTVGGTATITDAAGTRTVSSVPTDQIAHTFTLMAAPYDINVPIPAAQGETPSVVSFTLVLTQVGQFTWQCMAPCDADAMSTFGFMTGKLTVSA